MQGNVFILCFFLSHGKTFITKFSFFETDLVKENDLLLGIFTDKKQLLFSE